MEKAAIVTGASSGIGFEISKMLCGEEYEVFGFGRDFEREELMQWQEAEETRAIAKRFHPSVCEMTDTEKLCVSVRRIRREYSPGLFVSCAGVGYYGLHEELDSRKIREMVRINLEAPMILANLLLRDLKKQKGCMIFISSVTAGESNPHGCAYGATKAGLSSFSRSLFDEVRKYGVRVVTISPDMTKTRLYRNADFMQDDAPEAYLEPGEVADAVAFVLSRREGMLVSDITLKPQLRRIKRKTPHNLFGKKEQ